MDMSALGKGIGAGMITGAAVYAMTGSKPGKKRKLKHRTARAIHAIGDIAESIAELMS